MKYLLLKEPENHATVIDFFNQHLESLVGFVIGNQSFRNILFLSLRFSLELFCSLRQTTFITKDGDLLHLLQQQNVNKFIFNRNVTMHESIILHSLQHPKSK